ncbi:MAG: thiol:disulfide interchange protein DsbA/DsbL [Deltaproteobacteria bacterium]|jgi:thiol:disulfide interchange protein DsbA|nr:thiol:disulfide interchange protein DsbA/DsbL [Deltaproteobacteria bacterium]
MAKPPSRRPKLIALGIAAAAAAAVFLALFLGGRPPDQDLYLADDAVAQEPPASPAGPSQAGPPAQANPIVEGDDYKALGSVLTLTPENSEKPLELVYIFWYGCGTCRRIDPAVDQFVRGLPADVRAVRIPAMYEPNPLWMNHARLYYALDTLGKEAELHGRIFAAVQDEGGADADGHAAAGLAAFDQMARFAEQNGISSSEFTAAWNSPDTEAKFQRGLAFINNLDLDSVPAMGVNGRYAFPISRGGAARFFDTAQKLLADERARVAEAD